MLKPETLKFIRDCAREFDVKAVWLFGSALEDEDSARDFDLAVEGIVPKRFFDFYAKLFWELPKPVDLVDLSENLPIAGIVRNTGKIIYER